MTIVGVFLSIVCMFVLLLSGIGCSLFMAELLSSSSYCGIIFLSGFWRHWALKASRLLVETTDGSKDAGSSTSFFNRDQHGAPVEPV